MFGPNDIKIYKQFETSSKAIIQGHRSDSIYVLSAESTYFKKNKMNQNVDLWHMRLSHMSYDKLDLMMKKKMVGGQSQLEVSKGLVCAGC